MKAWNVTEQDIHAAIGNANKAGYNGNIKLKSMGHKGKAISFTLTVDSSKAPGAKRSHSGRRIAAACWHAHRDVLDALFARCSEARVQSGSADYRGAMDFRDRAEHTGYDNIGSTYQPMAHREACDCESMEQSA